MTELCEVVITAPDPEWLFRLTRALVADGLCASAHNFTPVLTVYRWQGQIHERTEGRASLHTRAELVSRIVDRVRAEGHPYQVPGISARPVPAMSAMLMSGSLPGPEMLHLCPHSQ